MPVCPQCGAQRQEGAHFCPACGTPLPGEAQPPRELRKTVTVLFADVSESTRLGEQLDPESLRRVMARFFDEMRTVLERHGGTVEKFIGDAVMAVFGIPVAHEDDALRAVRAAAGMADALARLNGELERDHEVVLAIRVGVNTGEVVAGDAAGQALVTGGAVNVAARLEQVAAPGEILLGESTYGLVAQAVRTDVGEQLTLRGREEPVIAYRLLGLVPGAPATLRQLDVPLVDRERELALLLETLERSIAEGSCRLFVLLGAPGVGKSRLAAEVISTVADRASMLVGRCLPYGDGVTYRPIVEVVTQAAGIAEDDPPERVDAKLGAVLKDADGQGALVAERVAQLIGVHEAALSNEEAFWAVRRFLEAIAHSRPLVVVFEDVHWAESTLLDLVEYISDWTRDVPLLLVCLARPELLDRRPGFAGRSSNAASLLLEPLGAEDSERLIDALPGGGELPEPVRVRIAEAAGGNPLFLEQMLAMAAEGGAELRVPPTIQALLAARLDALTPGERAVIERASVIGKEFLWEGVNELTPEPERAAVGEHLITLVRKELIRPEPTIAAGGHRFRFRHMLIRDAAYGAMPKETRATLHERFAGWLEGRTGDHEESAGYHLERAFRYRIELGPVEERVRALGVRAGKHLAAAGRRAFGRGDMPGAANLLDRASSLFPAGSQERLRLLPALGRAVRETGDLARADRILSSTIASAAGAGDRGVEALALIEQSALHEYTDRASRTDEVEALAERVIAVFEELGDDRGLARAWSLLADVHWTRCHFAAMEEVLGRALLHAERAGDEQERSLILNALSRAALLGPMPVEQAVQRCEEILAERRRDPVLQAVASAMQAGLYAMVGRFDEARGLYGRSRSILEEFAYTVWLATLPLYTGPVELLADDPATAERHLREGYESLRAMGEVGRLSTEAAFLAQALYAQGRYEEAERFTAESADAATPDDAFSQAAWRGTRAKTAARKGDYDQAEVLAREAVGFAQETDGLNLHGDSLLDLAEVLRLAGRPADAAVAVQRALALYERKGNLVSAARARAALAESPPRP